MTDEQLEKTMQFILERQAQFAADQQQAVERASRLEANMAANQQQVDERVTRLETNMAEMARSQAAMKEAIAAVGRSQAHLNEVVATMLDTHKHTEEKLDAFIGVLERYISEGRNGKAKGEDAT